MSIAELIITIPNSLIDLSELLYNIFFTTFKTPIGQVSLFAIIFGAGLTLIIGVRIIRLFLP